jgi:hypothetical protein
MAYTALQLITRAYYLSQVVSRSLQTVDGEQVTDGLYLLNELLDVKSSDLHLIPYFSEYQFNTVAGTESYFVPNLVYPDSVTFNIQDVRYSLMDLSRKGYFSTPRVDNVESLPYSYRVERKLNGSQIYFYFIPADIYAIKIWGKFSLTDVTLTTDLSLTYDAFYIAYLRYALAKKITEEWGATFPDAAMAEFQRIEKKLMMISPADLSIQKRSYFTRTPALDWQMINLPGWIPF